ncbi:MAG: YebC/PmpR family DNA-binding transcriptional regulator [Candidatus Pacebacteria bacterium]|nr:YebC/PmpR family DNA-binding transcriptional regulator [Candidatus Paceibacterota bacterium]
MSGHNKWSQIKQKKAITDGKKSKIFGKLGQLISMESKKAGGNMSSPGLRAVIERAKKENMTADAIERAVKKGAGADAGAMEAVLYETYGPGGCALMIECLTDNKNRTVAEIKHLLSKRGLALAGQGAASWAFTKTFEGFEPKGTTALSEEDGKALEELMEELDDHDDVQEVYTNAE